MQIDLRLSIGINEAQTQQKNEQDKSLISYNFKNTVSKRKPPKN